jgi:hypothetical protein
MKDTRFCREQWLPDSGRREIKIGNTGNRFDRQIYFSVVEAAVWIWPSQRKCRADAEHCHDSDDQFTSTAMRERSSSGNPCHGHRFLAFAKRVQVSREIFGGGVAVGR